MLTKEQVSALEARAMSSGESFLCTDDKFYCSVLSADYI